jgi:hypothetical protein
MNNKYGLKNEELINTLYTINEDERNVNALNFDEVKTLLNFVDNILIETTKEIQKELQKKTTSFSYRANRTYKYELNHWAWTCLKDILNERFKYLSDIELKGSSGIDYNSLFFDKKESEEFFIYIVDNWLKEEVNKTTALRFVFTKMWYKNNDKETLYKIISTQPYFARDYWNLKYSNIYEFTNPKNPKLNKDNFTEYYHKRFKKHLTEFQGG